MICLIVLHCPAPDKQESRAQFDEQIFKWSKTLAEVFHIIAKKYIQQVDPSEAMVKAINCFVSSLDPHSSFMDPNAYKRILEATQGEFFGIGVAIDPNKEAEQEFLKVIDIIPAGPADKAGLRGGDKIVEIDGESLKGLGVDEVVTKLKGKRHSTVHIKVQRHGVNELMPFDVVRDTVKEQHTLCYHFKEHNIYYVSLNMFTENSTKQIEELLKKCQGHHSKGLILDLRNNSGGLLNVVVDIAGLFLDKGSEVVVTKNREEQVIDTFATSHEPLKLNNVPVIILTNNFTASAAEILAGTLQYYSEQGKQKKNSLQIFLGGTKTFGKGSVQEVIPICNDCALKLTIALYYLPGNISIQGKGIKPDFELPQRFEPTKDMQWFNENFGRESSLKNSITVDPSKKKKDKKAEKPNAEETWQEKKQKHIQKDSQIEGAINLLGVIDTLQQHNPKKYASRKAIVQHINKIYYTGKKLPMQEITI